MKGRRKGVYCLEVGEWYRTLKEKCSVEPVLELLKQSPLVVPYIHRDIATQTELLYYLKKWTQEQHRDYPILYLGFHGSPEHIHLFKENGRQEDFSTDKLFDKLKGKCHNRVIHFGACSVLKVHGHKANRYLRDSGAVAISGYGGDVPWVTSAVFEMLYLAELQANQFTKSGLLAVRNRLSKMASQSGTSLGFRMVVKK